MPTDKESEQSPKSEIERLLRGMLERMVEPSHPALDSAREKEFRTTLKQALSLLEKTEEFSMRTALLASAEKPPAEPCQHPHIKYEVRSPYGDSGVSGYYCQTCHKWVPNREAPAEAIAHCTYCNHAKRVSEVKIIGGRVECLECIDKQHQEMMAILSRTKPNEPPAEEPILLDEEEALAYFVDGKRPDMPPADPPLGPPKLAGCDHEYWDRCDLCDPIPDDVKMPPAEKVEPKPGKNIGCINPHELAYRGCTIQCPKWVECTEYLIKKMLSMMFCPECRRKMKRFVAPGISDERWVCNTEGCDIFLITVKRKEDFYK